jgi:hypothetical protein
MRQLAARLDPPSLVRLLYPALSSYSAGASLLTSI